MAVWCKARAFSTAMYGLGQAMKMSGAIKREDRAMYKDRASGTDRRSVPMTVQLTPLAQVIRLSPNQDVQCEGGSL